MEMKQKYEVWSTTPRAFPRKDVIFLLIGCASCAVRLLAVLHPNMKSMLSQFHVPWVYWNILDFLVCMTSVDNAHGAMMDAGYPWLHFLFLWEGLQRRNISQTPTHRLWICIISFLIYFLLNFSLYPVLTAFTLDRFLAPRIKIWRK